MLPSNPEFYKYLLENKLAYPSLMILQDKISDHSIQHYKRCTFAFPNNGCDHFWPSEDVIDVCLYGDALLVLSDCNLWPRDSRYRLWVLCNSMKQLLMDLFELKQDEVGVVDRYKLFKVGTPSELQIRDGSKFVISSNFSLNKNVELGIYFINLLQNKYKINVELEICSPRPDDKAKLDLINSLEWTTRPKMSGNLGPNWIQHFESEDIILNLSTNLFEDFGVSLAQAQENGNPMIISNWGGHKEIKGDNIIKVPLDIFKMHNSNTPIKERALNLAEYTFLQLNKNESSISKTNEFYTKKSYLKSEILSLDIDCLINKSRIFNENYILETKDLYGHSMFSEDNFVAQKIISYFS